MMNPLQITLVRVITYALSVVLTGGAAALAGYGVTVGDGTVTIEIETLVGAVVAALGASGAIYRIWGKP